MTSPCQGRVSLVGAGPGDPELLTIGALRRLQEAAVVVHDALVSAEVLALCPATVRRINAGKRSGGSGPSQEWINRLLVSEARAGRRVVRLKGGDPYLYGRGGEEALALIRAGVTWEMVPGVSSALAVPARAGIPLTHRGVSSSVAIVAGHVAAGSDTVDWRALSAVQTLVVLMAGARAAEIGRALVKAGRPAICPVAIIQQGTLPTQETWIMTLGELARRHFRKRVASPALLVVGDVVQLADELGSWADPLLAQELRDVRTG